MNPLLSAAEAPGALTRPDLDTAGELVTELRGAVAGYLESSKAPATRRAYRSDLAHFQQWTEGAGLTHLPASPDTVALYIAALAGAGAKASTIGRRLASISVAHQMAGLETPTRSSLVRTTMQGIRRQLGTASRQVAPLRLATLRKIFEATPEETLAAVRDRAILLLGFSGGFRRSDLSGLNVEDLEKTEQGLVVHLRHSKTDQEGAGVAIGIPRGRNAETCPVTAGLRWISIAGISSGPLFRRVNRWDKLGPGRLSGHAIGAIVQRSLRSAGLDADSYAGHSLRSGFATEAAAHGASERSIMAGRWRSVQMVRRYIRDGELFTDNAGAQLGL